MDIVDNKRIASENNFEECPDVNTGTELISRFVVYSDTDLELKIYLAKLILCRSFYGTYTAWYDDVKWFINGFFEEYDSDHIKSWLSLTVKEAAQMILSDEIFTKGVIGTTFMFGVMEYYAKHKLGFRPMDYNFFDKRKKEYVKKIDPKLKNDLYIRPAFEYLQKLNLPVSTALNEIDTFTINKLTERGILSEGWRPHKIADRLNLGRNPMLHGETHTFYNEGSYLLMLYILFHLVDQAQKGMEHRS